MSVSLSEDHAMLVEAVRDFARGELRERDQAWDRSEATCCTELDSLYEMGILGLRVPESAGGIDCPMVPYAHIIRELAYASPSVAVTVGVHNMVAAIIDQYACDEVKSDLLPKLALPGNLSAFAISEPNAGSDPASARTRATNAADGFRLNGSKMWVTNGLTGRWFVVLARLGDGKTSDELCMFVVDATAAGVRRNPIRGKM